MHFIQLETWLTIELFHDDYRLTTGGTPFSYTGPEIDAEGEIFAGSRCSSAPLL